MYIQKNNHKTHPDDYLYKNKIYVIWGKEEENKKRDTANKIQEKGI